VLDPNGRLIEDPQQQKVKETVRLLRPGGASIRAIQTRPAEQGVSWSRDTIHRIVRAIP
jgi:transposase-like protein